MKMKREKKKEKKHTCGPRDIVDVSWAFSFGFPRPRRLPVVSRRSVVLLLLLILVIIVVIPHINHPTSSGS
jgi:hypothetical protein